MPDLQPLVDQIKSASLVDAMGRMFQHKCYVLDLISPTPGRIVFGQAITMNFMPVREDLDNPEVNNYARLFYEAMGEDGQGKVLVMASNGHPDVSMGGGTKHSRLQNHQFNALVTDGRLRDFDEFQHYDFATYCKGKAVRWGGDSVVPTAVNGPIVLDGIRIVPGDYVYADDAALVVIPESRILDVLQEAVRVEAEDAHFIQQIKAEDPQEILKKGSGEI